MLNSGAIILGSQHIERFLRPRFNTESGCEFFFNADNCGNMTVEIADSKFQLMPEYSGAPARRPNPADLTAPFCGRAASSQPERVN